MRTTVLRKDTVPSVSAPTDTGVPYVAGMSQKGVPGVPILIRSMAEFVTKLGTRQAYSSDYDGAELFFAEGGSRFYYSRVVGPAVAQTFAAAATGWASLNLAAATSGTALVVTANSPGDWANGASAGLTAAVTSPGGGSNRQITIYLNSVQVAQSATFTANTDAPAAMPANDYVTVTVGGGTGLVSVAAAANLTGGTDDRSNITQTQITAAEAVFARDLGPGQEMSPMWQTTAAGQALLASAAAHERIALCDTADVSVKATVLAAAAALQGDVNGSRGALVHPWLKIAGTAATTGATSRSVPLSWFVAARIAQTDSQFGANRAPAGEQGKARSALVLDVKATYSDADQVALEAAGVSLAITRYGQVLFDGDRTLVNPLGSESEWLELANARYYMSLVARLTPIGQRYEHVPNTIETRENLANEVRGVLQKDETDGMLELEPGEDPGSSFIVDTGPDVNTPAVIASGYMLCAVGFRPSRGADYIMFMLTNVGSGNPVA